MTNHVMKPSDENDFFEMSLSTLEKYYEAMNNNDLEGTLSMIHSTSPTQLPTRQILGKLMHAYKLKTELIETKFIGSDNGYICIRMTQKTTKVEGPDFKDNITDSLVAMKHDEKVWKIWSMMPLETKFI